VLQSRSPQSIDRNHQGASMTDDENTLYFLFGALTDAVLNVDDNARRQIFATLQAKAEASPEKLRTALYDLCNSMDPAIQPDIQS